MKYIFWILIGGMFLLMPESVKARTFQANSDEINSSSLNKKKSHRKPLKEKSDKRETMDQYISALMSKMTIDEKIGQLNLWGLGDITKGQIGAILGLRGEKSIKEVQETAVEKSRLGIPLLFAENVVHGYQTTFPIPLGLSCSWDIKKIEESAHIAAIEASADGINWTFAPMVDISHDARWGRVAEGSGEDPYLGSLIAAAMVKGFQGTLSSDSDILACVKHFALYGAVESGRDYNTVDMSRYRMYNEYFPPYKAAVDAGAGSIMTSFNTINGVPSTANKWLLTDLLRNQWHYQGFVTTDYTAISELQQHGLAGDLQQASVKALDAGVDMDMVSAGFSGTLKKSLQEGKITEAQIDNACRNVLEAKYKLGLFSDPYKYCNPVRTKKDIYTPEHLALSRTLADESYVLLKNENKLLPLSRKGTIAVIGPLANDKQINGMWSINPNSECSLVDGLKDVAGKKVSVLFAQGANLMDDRSYAGRVGGIWDNRSSEDLLAEALKVADKSDVIIAALGESANMSGECTSRSQIGIPQSQEKLLKALVKTGKPVVLVLFNGRPLVLNWEKRNVPAILDVWFGGSEAARAVGDILFGKVNPSGKLTMSFPQNVGQLPYSYMHENTGRPLAKGEWFQKFRSDYLDVSNDMLYPFGYGLSYTTYTYGKPELSSMQMDGHGSIVASVKVTNTGEYDGDEIVQMYLHQQTGRVARPVKELKGFQRIHLKSGESKRVSFTITPDMLKYYDNQLQYIAEPGEYDVMIGTNSEDLQSQSFEFK